MSQETMTKPKGRPGRPPKTKDSGLKIPPGRAEDVRPHRHRRRWEYRIFVMLDRNLETELNLQAEHGWKFVTIVQQSNFQGVGNRLQVLMEREAGG